jgi:hypothetical protein
MKDEGYLVDYARLPGKIMHDSLKTAMANVDLFNLYVDIVTDEQAPIPGVFSRLEQRVTRALKSIPEQDLAAHLVFNCQMGRGRTTTGMVAAMLVANSLQMNTPGKLERKESISSTASVDLCTPALSSPNSPTLSVGRDTWDVPEVNPYLEG